MRILFDQGTPAPLRKYLAGHEVSTTFELGWSRFRNGDLLEAAEAGFDLLITTDQGLRYQQDLTSRRIAILVLMTTNWPELKRLARDIAAVAEQMQPGDFREFKVDRS